MTEMPFLPNPSKPLALDTTLDPLVIVTCLGPEKKTNTQENT